MAHPIHSVYNGSEFASYLGPTIYKLIPSKIKAIEFLAWFKEKLKKWKPNDCHCRSLHEQCLFHLKSIYISFLPYKTVQSGVGEVCNWIETFYNTPDFSLFCRTLKKFEINFSY